VGHGDLFGEISDVFGLGGGAGCVCAIYVSQAGFRVRPSLGAYVGLCSSLVRSSEGRNLQIIGLS
jgi:hypothetical protein